MEIVHYKYIEISHDYQIEEVYNFYHPYYDY